MAQIKPCTIAGLLNSTCAYSRPLGHSQKLRQSDQTRPSICHLLNDKRLICLGELRTMVCHLIDDITIRYIYFWHGGGKLNGL